MIAAEHVAVVTDPETRREEEAHGAEVAVELEHSAWLVVGFVVPERRQVRFAEPRVEQAELDWHQPWELEITDSAYEVVELVAGPVEPVVEPVLTR